jgi:hypothetical protein
LVRVYSDLKYVITVLVRAMEVSEVSTSLPLPSVIVKQEPVDPKVEPQPHPHTQPEVDPLKGRKHEFLLTNVTTQCGQRHSNLVVITSWYLHSSVFGLLRIY